VRVAVFGGAGGVGASVAYNLLASGAGHEVALIDRRADLVLSHVMDLAQVRVLAGAGSVVGAQPDAVLDADIVVMTAAEPQRPTLTRLTALAENLPHVRQLAGILAREPGWGGIVLVITNPVDHVCTILQREAGLDRRRVIGYTLNDTLRFRTGIGLVRGLDPHLIDAWVLGEHGDGCVPVYSRIASEGVPIELTGAEREAVDDFLYGWFARHVALEPGRSSTWTSGAGIARMIAAIAGDRRERVPASVVLDGEYGIDGVSVTVPVVLARDGVGEIEAWSLAPAEEAALRAAAQSVRAQAAAAAN
jgi:malate/lactate dehydrogenase